MNLGLFIFILSYNSGTQKEIMHQYIEHNGGRTPIDENGYVSTGNGLVHHEAFRERLRCSAICEQYAAQMGYGPHTYAANTISARILGAR
jgi:hypothetical protein